MLHDSLPGQDRHCVHLPAPWLLKPLSGAKGPGSFFNVLSVEPLPQSYGTSPVPLLVPPRQNNNMAAKYQAMGRRKKEDRAQQMRLEEGQVWTHRLATDTFTDLVPTAGRTTAGSHLTPTACLAVRTDSINGSDLDFSPSLYLALC